MKKFFAAVVCPILLFSFTAAETAFSADPSWRNWRGPNNNGVADSDAPVAFSDTQNVKWRIKIPGKGHSTPVIWGDRMFLTTAVPTQSPGAGTSTPETEHNFMVMAIDRNTGKTIWGKTATTATPHDGFHDQYGSYASNSPITDGEMLYAYFGSRGVFAYDLDGNLQWRKDLPMQMSKRMGFGEGAAPFLHDNILILQCDHEGQSFILALDKNSGEELWRTDRDESSTWSQPVVVEHDGREQIVTNGEIVRSYDLQTGELIWQAGRLGGNAIPAPVQHEDMVIVMTGWRNANLLAIKLGGAGDLTGNPEYIKWTNERGNSYSASPVLHEGILYVLTDNGMISAFDAATGEAHYRQQRLPNPSSYKASPLAANGKLYIASERGEVTVIRLGKTYEVLSVNNMGDEMFVSSPVAFNDLLYLRSQDELFCIADMSRASR